MEAYYTKLLPSTAERYAATGNPPPGQSDKRPAKKIKAETPEEIKKRLAEHRARLAAQKNSNGGAATHTPPQGLPDGHSPGQSASPGAFLLELSLPPTRCTISRIPQPTTIPHAYPPSNLPSRPGSNVPAASGLPQRPGQPGWPTNTATPEELGVGTVPQQGDDIDQLIRMAEAGIRPPKKSETPAATEEAAQEKKSKKEKDKNVQMIYEDELSPEERMAMMPRYAFSPEAAAT
ncbi:hypothetical protein RRF57_006301 [Xylaria bambusicola]|uniref:Uncharacterized protein n=1 Tax=Xylaria bambusicola TaxID=326684 RepID=A0AAN7UQ08_9PEZI